MPQGSTYPNVSYGPNGNELLDIYTPPNKFTGTRPCLIMVHGGGWTSGDKRNYTAMAFTYTQLGYVVATVTYRLAPAAVWPQQVGDLQLAVRYIRNNAATYNINPNKLIGFGDSAGGHLILHCGALSAIHTNSDTASILPSVSPQTQGTISLFGPADLVDMYNTGDAQAVSAITALMNNTTPTSNPTGYADASVTNEIPASGMGPVLVLQGSTDSTCPPGNSTLLINALNAKSVPNVQYIFGGGHEWLYCSFTQYIQMQNVIINWLLTNFPPQ